MAKKAYIGTSGNAREIKKIYIGVGGVARKVKKGFVGVQGKARQFYASEFFLAIEVNIMDLKLRDHALSAGWDGQTHLVVNVAPDVYLYSSSTASSALTISGAFPEGLTFINNGVIIGRGGNGGTGTRHKNGYGAPTPGGAGGLAIHVQSPVRIENTGIISGGGGGGGGGGGDFPSEESYRYLYDGSGGGGGIGGSSGGAGGGGKYGQNGGSGTLTGAGGGGYCVHYGHGGAGGSYGAYGGGGGRCMNGGLGAAGGSGGACISGNAFVTWVAPGTRYGAIIN